MTQNLLAIFGLPGGGEWIIILIIAVLIFGRRLPEIARGLGKSIWQHDKTTEYIKAERDEWQ